MCRFEGTVTVEPGGSGRTTVRCQTHHFTMALPIETGTLLCPIGQIEKARDVALLEIANAREAAIGALPHFETPNV